MVKKDEVEELKNDDGVVLVESRAAQVAEVEPAAGAETAESESGDLVKLTSKKKKPKRKATNNDGNGGLF